MSEETRLEKLVLLALSGACIASLTWIALASLESATLDPNAATLIGVIAAGLIAFGKDIVGAIRSYSMSAQLGKVTDQLAASGPVPDSKQAPEGAEEAADQVVEAASDERDKIAGAGQ